MQDTEKDIKDYEEEVGVILPSDYKDILLGKLKKKYYWSDYYIYYTDIDDYETQTGEFEFYKIQSIYVSDKVPRTLGEIYASSLIKGADWICIGQNCEGYLLLSVKGENYGKVYFVDPPHASGLDLIANSVKEFIDKLERDRDLSEHEFLLNVRDYNSLKEKIVAGEIDINLKMNDNLNIFQTVLRRMVKSNKVNSTDIDSNYLEQAKFIKYFVDLGLQSSNINEKDNNGMTPLMIALSNIDAIKFLIELEADMNIKNNNGQTALDIAINSQRFARPYLKDNYNEIITFLTNLKNINEKKTEYE